MANKYSGEICPICRNKIKDADEVAVCPVCGTPHHRACFKPGVDCAVANWHGKYEYHGIGSLPDEFQPEGGNAADKSFEVESHNAGSAQLGEEFINRLYSTGEQESFDNSEFDDDLDKQAFTELHNSLHLAIIPAVGASVEQAKAEYNATITTLADSKKNADGVSMREISFFVMQFYVNFINYLPKRAKGEKVRKFSFSAFLLSPVYQFFRKMFGFGVITMLSTLFLAAMPVIAQNLFHSDPQVVSVITHICMVIDIALPFLWGFISNDMFYRSMVKKIRRVRKSFGDKESMEYYHALTQAGTPSIASALLGLLAYAFVAVFMMKML